MKRLFSSPFLAALSLNLIAAVVFALLAGTSALRIIDHSVDRKVKEEISREISLLTDRNPEHGALPPIASLSTAVSRRMFQSGEDNAQSVYLLADANNRVIVGNANKWPIDTTNDAEWHRLDGTDMGISEGPVLLKVTIFPKSHHKLLVGRKLTARKALLRQFIPVLILTVLGLSLMSCAALLWLNRRYQNRIQLFNSVFSRIEDGELSARIPKNNLRPPSSELSHLGSNINVALDEVQRFMAGLDSYSQVAAHELNHAISKMRERFIANGNIQSIEDTDQLLELVSQILHLVKIETSPEFAMQIVNLSDVAQSVADLFTDTLEDNGVEFKRDFGDRDVNIQGSVPLIASAMTNLMSNAVKHAPKGSTVTLSLTAQENDIKLSISDEGPGVPTTDIAELAELGNSGSSGGYGFGLRHVQAIAIRHGARFTLRNANPGLKATIRFTQSRGQ